MSVADSLSLQVESEHAYQRQQEAKKPSFQWHVVMPFHRWQNAELYYDQLRSQNVIWHPLVDRSFYLPLFQRGDDWVKPHVVDLPRSENPCFYQLDYFGQNAELVDGDYYTFMADDCFWEHNFWPRLQDCMQQTAEQCGRDSKPLPEVVFHSALRRQGDCKELVPACPENVGIFVGDLIQLSVRGDVYRQERFGRLWFADGMLMSRLACDRVCLYARHLWVYYNALRSGQWGFPGIHE